MPYHLLLVDDDDDFREEICTYLTDEFRIIEAKNGREALSVLSAPHLIDVAVLDVSLPDISGTELLREMRARFSDLGIVILTGRSSEETAIEALKGHADDYLEKPVEPAALKACLRALLSRKLNQQFAGNGIRSKIEKVKYLAQRNCHKTIHLGDAAGAVCLSPKYLSRAFKKQSGYGFNEYCLKIKTDRAKQALLHTDYNISDIAHQFGYMNAASFIKVFKRNTGCTPARFRLMFQKRGNGRGTSKKPSFPPTPESHRF